jgi:CobQ-like glutamine amidotransferase family enzyme
MVIEVLFGEVCNLYGDPQNVEYLSRTLSEAKIIKTSLDAEPYFSTHRPDMILIGSMSDAIQLRAIDKLGPYKDRIAELIDGGVVFLATGNACEIFCKSIENVTLETKHDALGLFDLDVKTNWFDRYNGKVLGKHKNMVLTGFKSQFSMIYGDNSDYSFVNVERGIGINRESKLDGFVRNNFFGTQMLGPILPLNPEFCEYLISLTGEKATAAFKDVAMDAYNQRVKEFSDPKIKFD